MKSKKKQAHKESIFLDVLELVIELIGPIVKYTFRAITKIFD